MPIPFAALPFAASAISSIGSAISGNRAQKEANKLAEQQRQFEEEKWNAGAPFRNAGTQMLNRQVDPAAMTQLFRDEGNPYAANTQFQSLWKASEPQAAGPQVDPQAQRYANDMRVVAAGQGGRMGQLMNQAADKMLARNTQQPSSIPQERAQLDAFRQTMVPNGGRR